eukprot:6136045-Alexandrium_andersonii.AAC.1
MIGETDGALVRQFWAARPTPVLGASRPHSAICPLPRDACPALPRLLVDQHGATLLVFACGPLMLSFSLQPLWAA